ncbi:MAG: MBL fold metallo-hydrolase [Opitutaceae bacterium]
MGLGFGILGSGSSGNSALLVSPQARVLIDAGMSARRLDRRLADLGESLDRIDAVFLTHEHGDHAAGLVGLKRLPGLPIFANAATARAAQEGLGHRPNWRIFETGAAFRFRDLEVRSFSVPHDAHDPVGFRFNWGRDGDLFEGRRSLVLLTDLGHVPPHIHEQVRDCDVIVLEANHCPRLLEADPRRPWSLKQRIAGRHGHLSNDAARALLSATANPAWRRVYLTHLSRECNSREAVAASLAGLRPALGCEFAIVDPGAGTALYRF